MLYVPAKPLQHGHTNFLAVIHGDIKPENILIDLDESGAHVPKIADYGYSSDCSMRDDIGISMPKSEPWHPPEWETGRKYAPDEAKNMDIFSFATTCLWFLFHDSKFFPRPAAAAAADDDDELINLDPGIGALREHRQVRDDLMNLAQEVVAEESHDLKNILSDFFSAALSKDSTVRQQGLDILIQQSQKNSPSLDKSCSIGQKAPDDDQIELPLAKPRNTLHFSVKPHRLYAITITSFLIFWK